MSPSSQDATVPDADNADAKPDNASPTDAAPYVDGSVAMDGADSGDASTCDPNGDLSVNPCAIDTVNGVFVSSSSGFDDAGTPGTESAPWNTITEGIAAAIASGRSRVYVCGGTYAEQVALDATHDGVSVYGGFDCGSVPWAWSGSKVMVNAPSALYALRIDATTKPIVVADIAFTTPDATGQDTNGNGNSSIAGFVSNETAGVALLRTSLTAGMGADGAAGGPPATNWFSANLADLQGNPADTDGGVGGGPGKRCPCMQWGDSTGGAGGRGAGDINGNTAAGDGGAGSSDPATTPQGLRNGAGGDGYLPNQSQCVPGNQGQNGVSLADGGAGAPFVGSLTSVGWVPGEGVLGAAGNPGQGGGGGGGGQVGGGGGGGCGGCGGAGGTVGGGGGASVALLVFASQVNVQANSLATASAGNGGSGGAGENGSGGGGGNVGACGGGPGGNGAGGQGGGGGAGGVSVGVLSDATSTVTTDTATHIAVATQPATGGAGGGGSDAGSPANAGPPGSVGVGGIARQTMSL